MAENGSLKCLRRDGQDGSKDIQDLPGLPKQVSTSKYGPLEAEFSPTLRPMARLGSEVATTRLSPS